MAPKLLRILVVEDDALQKQLITQIFNRISNRYKIVSVPNLKDAISALNEQQFDVIISDLYLPDGKGTDLIHKYPDIPVIAITSHGDEMLAAQIMKAGAADYIQKNSEAFETLPKIVDDVVSSWEAGKTGAEERRLHYHMPTILDTMSDGVVVTDLDGQIVYINRGAEQILEIKRDTLLGTYYADEAWVNVDENEEPISEKALPLYQALNERKTVDHFEYGLARREYEKIKWISVNANPLYDSSGSLFGALATFRDITDTKELLKEIKQNQRLVNAITSSSHALLIALDYEGRIVRFNDACEEVSGYSFEELEGKAFWDYLIPEDEKEELKKVFFELRDLAQSNKYQNYWIGKNGEKSFITWTNTVVRDEKGRFEYVLGTGIDMSEQKREEERRLEELKNEIDALTQFAFKNTTSATAGSYGQAPLKESEPEAFYDAVSTFTDILNKRMEKLTFRVETDDSRDLRLLGERIGLLKGKPKDIIDVFTVVLSHKVKNENPAKARALRDEGRLLVLELMGHLASFYRKYYTGIINEERR